MLFVIQNECLSYKEYVSVWELLSKETDENSGIDSIWLRLESSFNIMTKKLLLSSSRNDMNGFLRLVLDDDKLHCDGLKPGMWSYIKRVKHTAGNRWGANIHTLAGAVSGVIDSLATETRDDTTMDFIRKNIDFSFRMGNRKRPNLKNILLGLDRGYDSKNLVSYITQNYGHVFGTSKRTVYCPYTYNQKKRGEWDKRTFMESEGCILVERKVAKLFDQNNQNIADITSIFYRNGFGGATILHSTLPSHKLDEWDRIPKRKVNPKQSNKEMFLRPHSICSIRTNAKRRGDLWRLLRDDIEMITEEQNI